MIVAVWLVSVGGLLGFPIDQAVPDPVPAKLIPADEARLDPELLRTRDALLRAARAGDLDTIWRLTSPDVQVSWDGKRGLARLKREWNVARSPKRFLDELAQVLLLGGRFDSPGRDSFVAPSMYADFPDPGAMPAYRVAIRKDAPVY